MGLERPQIDRPRQVSLPDANSGWTLSEAEDALPLLEEHVSAIEQPLSDHDDAHLPDLAVHTKCDLIADESLITLTTRSG